MYLGAAHLQTLDQAVPALGKAVQSGLQLVGHLFVFDTGQQVLAHGAQLVHGGTLHLQVCLHGLVVEQMFKNTHTHTHTHTHTQNTYVVDLSLHYRTMRLFTVCSSFD